MLTVLSVVFLFALPYPKKAAWLKGTAVGRVLNNYDWYPTDHCFPVSCHTAPWSISGQLFRRRIAHQHATTACSLNQ